ncbi:MAG: hypothetical protein M0Z27_10840 [Thermaerobacter sp.]|nr:hypothetical protein [Thermaerobacter sp.]MDA8146540.1 hypothetical protein [Thermaerobacter sp.]
MYLSNRDPKAICAFIRILGPGGKPMAKDRHPGVTPKTSCVIVAPQYLPSGAKP